MKSQTNVISKGHDDDPDILFDHKIITMPDKHTFPSHSHDMCELLYFIGGEASYYVEGNVYSLRPGDLVFIRAAKHHMLVVNGGADYERYVTIFSRSLLPKSLYEKTKQVAEVVNFGKDSLVGEFFAAADAQFGRGLLDRDEYQIFLRSMIVAVCSEFLRLAAKSELTDELSTVGKNTFHLALMHINKNLHDIKNIDEVCRSLYITKRYLHHLFKVNLGITPKKYMTEKRLLMAKRQMQSGKSPTEAYRIAGFTDYTTFYRNYKSYFGSPPSEHSDANA